MPEQRNVYKGSPFRPWMRIVLLSDKGAAKELDVLADTGNPCALIIDPSLMQQFNLGIVPGMTTNFGRFDGGWLRVQIPAIGFDEDVIGYSSDAVVNAVQADHADFAGLAGLPLLRLAGYGGDRDAFWIRKP